MINHKQAGRISAKPDVKHVGNPTPDSFYQYKTHKPRKSLSSPSSKKARILSRRRAHPKSS
jgi:hypothetical protein